ncbi:MAG TPA: Wzz/FepE/Etk N-terminal domain-containing protein, partial [Paraburkholderia sp.]
MATNFDSNYAVLSTDERYLGDYLQTLASNWRLILLVTLAFTLLGSAYAFLASPTYRADVLFHVIDKSDTQKKDDLPPLTGVFDTKTSATGEIEMLKSRLVTEETVRALHLDISARPREVPFIGGMLSGLATGRWGARLPASLTSGFAWGRGEITVTRFDTPAARYDDDFRLIAGEGGTFVLRDPDGVALLDGRVGEDINANT